MKADYERFRPVVTARAGGACEYCRLIEVATGVTFHIDHILPRSRGGKAVLTNLALACPGCNLSKLGKAHEVDDLGERQFLFNPRAYDPSVLGWHIHFLLDPQTGLILPRSHLGEATIRALDMNCPSRFYARSIQIKVGLLD